MAEHADQSHKANPMDRLKAALAAQYEIQREVGQGGTATVYLARDPRHDRNVALKVLRPELAATLGTDRFLQEIKHVARLQHPHILPLYDSGEAGGFLYYVTPYIEGESLRDRLDELGPLDVATARQYAREMASALDYAHAQGLVHRDIKPHNILLSSGHVLVADFGIARALGATSDSGMTMTGATLGTPLYMSPEQLAGSDDLDGRSDQYSLACVVFEMLAGEPPFPGKSIETIVARRLEDPTPSLHLRKGIMQPGIDAALKRAMAREPAERFATVSQFANALVLPSDTTAAMPAAPKPAKPAIAVLPFANLSADPENEYFSDGLTEEIIADLSQVNDLRVISRTSSMRYKGGDHDIKTIASELDVHFVLEGSVRKAGSSLRITAQLIDAASDEHLWAEKYSGTVDDVFDIQEKVSRSIVDSLEVKLTARESDKLAERPIADPAAYDLYLRAKQGIWTYGKEGLDRAVRELEHALELIGENVTIYQWLAIAYMQYPNAGISNDPRYLARAKDYVEKLQEMAPESAECGMVQAFIEVRNGKMVEVVRHLRRALELKENDPDMTSWLALGYAMLGQDDRASELVPRALELDPMRALVHWSAGFIFYLRGESEPGLELVERGSMLEPESSAFAMQLAQILVSMGEIERAEQAVGRITRDRPKSNLARMGQAMVAAAKGDRRAAQELMTDDLLEVTWGDLQYAHFISQIYAILGDRSNMMKWLRQAIDCEFLHYPFFSERDVLLAPYRNDPEFKELMEQAKSRWLELNEEFATAPS